MAKFEWPNQDPGRYLTEAEKNELIGREVVFAITGAKRAIDPFDKDHKAERAEWTVTIPAGVIDDAAVEKVLAFGYGDVPTRDQILVDMLTHFQGGGEPIDSKLVENGRVKLIVPAE